MLTLKEKIDCVKKIKGGKNYLIKEFIQESKQICLINTKTHNINELIKGEEEVDKALKEIKDVTDISHMDIEEQIKIYHEDFIEKLKKDKQEEKYKEARESHIGYWYIRGIGDKEEYRGEPMSLQYCVADLQAEVLAEEVNS